MRTIADFYAERRRTRLFLARADAYTIIKGRHAGTDFGRFGGVAEDVPCLYTGRVVTVIKTEAMGYVIVIDTGLPGVWRYHAYCHIAGEDLPSYGATVRAGERVGRLAAGPRGVRWSSVDYPGTWATWDGIHLHLVMCAVATGAYIRGAARPDQFGNPEDFIRDVLSGQAAGGGSRPFDPEEDEDMPFTDQDREMLREVRDLLTPGKEGVKFDGNIYAMLRDVPRNAATAVWNAEVGRGTNRRSIATVIATIADNVTDIPGKVWGATLGRGSKRRTISEMLTAIFNRGGS